MTKTGSIAISLAILLASVPALAEDVSGGGYSCGGRAEGAYGRVWLDFNLKENGEFSSSMGQWDVATPITPVKTSPNITVLRQDTELKLYFKTDTTDQLKPLRPAWLYVQRYVYPLPDKPTYLYLTLADGRYVRAEHISSWLLWKWRNSEASGFSSGIDIEDPEFLDAFTRSPSLAIDVIQIDGVPVSRTVLYLKDGASELQRLYAQVVADSKGQRSTCSKNSLQSIETIE